MFRYDFKQKERNMHMHILNTQARRVGAAIAAGLLLSQIGACTPEQLATWRKVDPGYGFTQSDESVLVAQPDAPLETPNGYVIDVNGAVVGSPDSDAEFIPGVTVPVPPTVTELTVEQQVNALDYGYGDAEPALMAYRMVAEERGWAWESIKYTQTAINDIMALESGYCWNVLGGGRVKGEGTCELRKQGKQSDAGFGQLIKIHHKWLCPQEGLCSKWDIIASPYNSMTALVALLERSGTSPWCYSKWARKYHRTACNAGVRISFQ